MPPDVVAPDPVSLLGIVMVASVPEGVLAIINFLSAKSDAPKLELVIAVNVLALPNKRISPASRLCAPAKVKVTVGDPFVVLKKFVAAVPDGFTKGCMS